MTYKVYLLPSAKKDLQHIIGYLHERSPKGAHAWQLAFEAALEKLANHPLRYRLAPESEAFDIQLRQILFGTKRGYRYRMIYRVDDDRVTIYRLRGKGQAPLRQDNLA